MNKVLLIGNLTRDPELRYTPQGNAVCTFGLATNRSWTTEDGGKKEEPEFHTIVAWNRLAEICAEYLAKGRQAFVEGRLSTREWAGQDGVKRRTTEVIASEVIFLSAGSPKGEDIDIPADFQTGEPAASEVEASQPEKKKASSAEKSVPESEDIPF